MTHWKRYLVANRQCAIATPTDTGEHWRNLVIDVERYKGRDSVLFVYNSFEKRLSPHDAIDFLQEAIDWIRAQTEDSP